MNFTRKGYGRIFVMNKVEIPIVDEIIKEMDEFEHEYLPDDFIASFSEYPKLKYTGKFDSLDIDKLTAICWKRGIPIFCCDSENNPYATDKIENNSMMDIVALSAKFTATMPGNTVVLQVMSDFITWIRQQAISK